MDGDRSLLPTLTLFHGTSNDAAESIVACPNRGSYRGRDVGIWRVGGGNYAGNGIYFAPARSTARHYSETAFILHRHAVRPDIIPQEPSSSVA